MSRWRGSGLGMEEVQRRRFRDFVALVIVAVYFLGAAVAFTVASLFDAVARERAPAVLTAFAGIEFSLLVAAYQVRPRPMDRRVLLPIETGSLLLLAATVASNLISALGGSPYLAASVILITVAVAFIVVGWQVSEVVGPKPVRTMEIPRSKTR
jgi:peptidoglycan/LPS O-acetylase OafA/YrhL